MKSNNNELICVEVGLWADAEKSYNCLVDKGIVPGSFSRSVWFPKKLCIVRQMKKKNKVVRNFLVSPKWILEKNNVNLTRKIFPVSK